LSDRPSGGVACDVIDAVLAPEHDPELHDAADHDHEQPDYESELHQRLAAGALRVDRLALVSPNHGGGGSIRNSAVVVIAK